MLKKSSILLCAPLLVLLPLFFSSGSFAATIAEIRIEGNSVIETDAVLKVIQSKKGDLVDQEKIAADIKAIYAMGYFTNIEVEVAEEERPALVFRVYEKLSVRKVEINGNKKIDEDEIKETIATKGGTFVDEEQIIKDLDKIRTLYSGKGFYLASIKHELKEIRNNKATLVYEIVEGKKVQVKWINFFGNNAFDDEELKKQIQTKEGGVLGLLTLAGITSAGAYSDEKFDMDGKFITQHYLKNGYINVKVESPKVFLSNDLRWASVNITIAEGLQYRVGTIDFSGDLLFSKTELFKNVSLETGEILNWEELMKDIAKIQSKYQDEGYAYANVIPRTAVSDDRRLVDLNFEIEKGEKVYIERIDILGNISTRDKIVRRHMEIVEGDTYSITKLHESEFNIRRYPYFKNVKIKETKGSSENKMILTVEVEEAQTGVFTVGAGINSVENFQLLAQIQKQNLLGRGWIINLQTQLGSRTKVFNVNFVEPFLADTDLSLSLKGFNQYYRYEDFSRNTRGGSFLFGYPIYKKVYYINWGYTFEDDVISTSNETQRELISGGQTSSVRVGFSRDTRNRLGYFLTTSGSLATLTTEFAGARILGGDNEFGRLEVEFKKYIPVFDKDVPVIGGSTFQFRAKAGYIFSLNKEKPVPIFERYFPGGIYSIRGFEIRSLGPSIAVASSTDPVAMVAEDFKVGGNKELLFNFEYVFPIFEAGGINGVVFYDMGNAFNNGEFYSLQGLRYSMGFGIRWFSPLAPFSFEWGFPLDRKEGERSFAFDFSVGTPF